MKKTIIIYDDRVEILKDGYNIIEQTHYDSETLRKAKELLQWIEDYSNIPL